MEIEQIDLDTACEFADQHPCFSMMALTTYLFVKKHYPVPLDPDQQEIILNSITDQVVVSWEEGMEIELEGVQDECSQSDIDFDFVIDSSGSVGLENWELTMKLIGENWIKEVVVPHGSKTCGNHVAGRWFSSDTARFHDFEPPSKETYAPQSYADWVGDIFINYPYNSGGTDTAKALQKTRLEDMPTARDGLKYVMVFTDGASNDNSATVREANELHKVANRTYAFGIGSGINMNELEQIASDKRYFADMSSFSLLQAFVRSFVIDQKGCYTPKKQAHRAINLQKTKLYGYGLIQIPF